MLLLLLLVGVVIVMVLLVVVVVVAVVLGRPRRRVMTEVEPPGGVNLGLRLLGDSTCKNSPNIIMLQQHKDFKRSNVVEEEGRKG